MTYQHEFVIRLNAEHEKDFRVHGICRCAAKPVGFRKYATSDAPLNFFLTRLRPWVLTYGILSISSNWFTQIHFTVRRQAGPSPPSATNSAKRAQCFPCLPRNRCLIFHQGSCACIKKCIKLCTVYHILYWVKSSCSSLSHVAPSKRGSWLTFASALLIPSLAPILSFAPFHFFVHTPSPPTHVLLHHVDNLVNRLYGFEISPWLELNRSKWAKPEIVQSLQPSRRRSAHVPTGLCTWEDPELWNVSIDDTSMADLEGNIRPGFWATGQHQSRCEFDVQ